MALLVTCIRMTTTQRLPTIWSQVKQSQIASSGRRQCLAMSYGNSILDSLVLKLCPSNVYLGDCSGATSRKFQIAKIVA